MSAAFASISEADLVREAADCARRIVRHKQRWTGAKYERAAELAAEEVKVESKTFAALRYEYRWPKAMTAGAYLKLKIVAERIEALDDRLNEALDREIKSAEAKKQDDTKAYRFALASLDEPTPLTRRRP